MFLTYKYRVKDATTGAALEGLAWSVNTAWNRLMHEQHEVQRHYCAEMGPNLPWPGLIGAAGTLHGAWLNVEAHL